MMNVKAGSKVVSVSGKSYTATGRSFECGGASYVELVATPENDFKRDIETRCIAKIEEA